MIQHSDDLITYNRGYGNTGNLAEAARWQELCGQMHIENHFEKL